MIFCNLDSETNLMFANVKLKDKFMELWHTSVAERVNCVMYACGKKTKGV